MTTAAEEAKALLATRKEAGLKIDPETAEVDWHYALTLDPYGIGLDLPEELQQVGREYFARSPGSDIWVRFGDLPDSTRKALWRKHSRKPAFPAGLFGPTTPLAQKRIDEARARLPDEERAYLGRAFGWPT
jgi:hypothetical protein